MTAYYCEKHGKWQPCGECLTDRIAALERERDEARAALLDVYGHCWSYVEVPTVVEQATAIKRYIDLSDHDEDGRASNPHIGSVLDVAHLAETGEVRTYDCRSTHHEGCACHEARHRAEVERLTRERDAAWRTIARLNRRAQEAERIANRALRVGLDVAEGMRAIADYWRRTARSRAAVTFKAP